MCAVLTSASILLATAFYVAPSGDDANPGTAERPFATAARARDALRAEKDRGPAEVVFLKGVHRVRETLALDERDSHTVWRGEEGAVLDGGFEVTNLRKLGAQDTYAIQQMSPVAFSNALVADVASAGYAAFERQCRYGGAVGMNPTHVVPTRLTPLGTTYERMTDLWCNGEPMELAREPDVTYLRLGGIDNAAVSFLTDSPMKGRLARERELMVCGFWHWNYLDETASVASMTPDGRVTMDDCIFLLNCHYRKMNANQPYFFVNALCALDRPGEWFLDRTEGKLYLIPCALKKGPDNKPPAQHYVLSQLADEFVTVTNACDIAFRNLAFAHGKRHGIVARACSDLTVEDCRIERLGGRALVLQRVERARVENCFIRYLGTSGIQLVSGDRVTLTGGESVVRGNDVSFTSLRRRTYSPALDLDGVGTLVEKNYLHDLRSSAINMRGNDQRIYNNYIERAVQESDDQGALDTYGFVSFQGNRIVGNVWKDIGGEAYEGYIAGQAGVRLDDRISGVYVASNVFINAAKGNFGAIQVNGGRANVFEDNVFVGCRSKADAAITIGVNTAWSWHHCLSMPKWQSTAIWHEDMFSAVYKKYPMMRENDLVTRFKDDNVVRCNYVTGCRDVLRRSHWDPHGYWHERDCGEDGRNLRREDPRVEMRFLDSDGSIEAEVRYDRKNGAAVRIRKASEPTPAAVPTAKPAKRSDWDAEKFTMGAIRWDAWYGDGTDEETKTAREAVRSLLPAEYRWRLPFFAEVAADGTVTVDGRKPGVMEREIDFAADHGLDYWAFLSYERGLCLNNALPLYLKAKNRNRLRFCLILRLRDQAKNGRLWPELRDRWVAALGESGYMKVCGGRELVYVYPPVEKRYLDEFVACAKRRGHNPYLVGMTYAKPAVRKAVANQCAGMDAVGAYNFVGDCEDYDRMTDYLEEHQWEAAAKDGLVLVPTLNAGCDASPRRDTPVSWQKTLWRGRKFHAPVTRRQLTDITRRAKRFVLDHPTTCEAKTCLWYAWNEFDEGGWICPTRKEDGSADVTRLEAVKAGLSVASP